MMYRSHSRDRPVSILTSTTILFANRALYMPPVPNGDRRGSVRRRIGTMIRGRTLPEGRECVPDGAAGPRATNQGAIVAFCSILYSTHLVLQVASSAAAREKEKLNRRCRLSGSSWMVQI